MAANLKKLTLYPDRDFDIIRLCELISQTDDVNFSELTTFAVEYYLRTGKYITIGYVQPIQYDISLKMTPKNIYVKKNSLFDQWANSNKGMPGFTLTNQVRNILHASIKLVDKEESEHIISLYDIMLELRKAGTGIPVLIPEPTTEEKLTIKTVPVEKKSEPAKENTIKEETKPQKTQNSAEKERDAAMSSAFLGGRKLNFLE